MNYQDFKALVKEMRQAQKKYFRTRDKNVLAKSKELEAKVDEVLSDQQQLEFGEK